MVRRHRPSRKPPPATTEATDAGGLLDQVVGATKQTEPDRAQDLLKTLTEQALEGTVTFDKNLTAHHRPGDRGDRRQAVEAAQRDHAPPASS